MLNYTLGGSMHTLTHWQSADTGEKWGTWQDGETHMITMTDPLYIYSEDGQLFAIEIGIEPDDYPEGFFLHNYEFSVSSKNNVMFRMNGNTQPESEREPHYYYSDPIPISNMKSVWGDEITPEQFKARPEPEERATWIMIGYVQKYFPDTITYYNSEGEYDSNTFYDFFEHETGLFLHDESSHFYTWKYLFMQICKGRPTYDT